MQKGGGVVNRGSTSHCMSASVCDFCHPRLPINRRRANWTLVIWRLLWSFQLKPTLTRQFISHCDIDFSNNHFISGRWGIPRTRPWRSFDWSCWRRIPAIFGCNMIWNFDCVKCRWHIVTLWLLSGSGLRLGLELPHDNSFGAQSQCDLDFAHTFLSVSVSF